MVTCHRVEGVIIEDTKTCAVGMSPCVVIGLTGVLVVAILSAGCRWSRLKCCDCCPDSAHLICGEGSCHNDNHDRSDDDNNGAWTDFEPYLHTIVKNDNPSYLADLYNITLAQLNDANRSNPDYSAFPIGGMVIIPAGGIMPNAALVLNNVNTRVRNHQGVR